MVDGYEYSTLEVATAIIPKVGGALSLIACSFIMRDVSAKWREKLRVSLTSILIFCISVADWLASFFSAFMSTWMAPSDALVWDGRPIYLAAGNTATCTAQGFITTLTIAASMSYYAVLMIYYWMSVHYGWSEAKSKQYRWYFILPPAIIALGLSIPPIFFDFYNPGGYACFLSPYPIECSWKPDVECIRGGPRAWHYHDAYWIYCMVCSIVVIVCVCMLIYIVFRNERKTDRYLTKGQEKRRVNTNKTIWQGIRYVGAFMLAYFSMYIITGYRMTEKAAPEVVAYMGIILTPLLGLFNSFVYFRPRYIVYRENNIDDTRITALANVFDIHLDYLSETSERLSKRLSSSMGASISRNTARISASISRGSTGSRTGSDFSAGDGIIGDADLTSPLFRDDDDDDEESIAQERVVSFRDRKSVV